MENLKKEFQSRLLETKREGVENVIKHLDRLGFFVPPAQCAEGAINGVNSMRTSFRSIEPKGIEDYLKELCLIYRGEMDNPHDVDALLDEERAIKFLKYNLLDVERSILESHLAVCS